MTATLMATTPNDHQYAEFIRQAVADTRPTRVLAAVAYATHSGVAELNDALQDEKAWRNAKKQWLVGIDHCRSDPIALAHLDSAPRSSVRIFDGAHVCQTTGCVPRTSYHPKLYLLQGLQRSAAVVGSGNLSRTGLRYGVEAAATVVGKDGHSHLAKWFGATWRRHATPFDEIEQRYARQYASLDNRRHPAPSEDDAAPESTLKASQLGPSDLRRMRVCSHLWIEAGQLTPNRGAGQPGNQLMMKRNSRVFFGFSPADLCKNTKLGNIAIRYGEDSRPDCSLRFGDNSMDILTLPIPGDGGPDAYDDKTLRFERVGVRTFKLTIGRGRETSRWQKRSLAVDGAYKMKGGSRGKRGRRWGVY